MTETRFFVKTWFLWGSVPPFSAFAKLQYTFNWQLHEFVDPTLLS